MKRKPIKRTRAASRDLRLAICAVVLIFAILTALLLWQNRGRIALFFSGIGEEKVVLQEAEMGVRRLTLEELAQLPGCQTDQSMMLINTEYLLPSDFSPSIAEYKTSEVMMNRCILDAYAALSADIREKFDQKLYVSSSVRDAKEQEALYREDPTTATIPGASEHQSGLALDVYIAYYAGDGFLDSAVGQYVNARCQDYGFIIRYPSYGVEQTGIRFEPWHIRYVGQPHARIIASNRLTLEEYILSLKPGTVYMAEQIYILRAEPDAQGRIAVPDVAGTIVCSPDNTGCYIVTVMTNA